MLLEFQTENYKSFKDLVSFSMIPASKQKGLDYSILRDCVGKKEFKALSVAVVYGPNAAGKTNIIGAMQTLKTLLLRGNILNTPNNSLNFADCSLELIPNNKLKEKRPVYFLIKFIFKNILISYSLKLDLGLFLEKDYERKIIQETLSVNNRIVFVREENEIKELNTGSISGQANPTVKRNKKASRTIAEGSLKRTELFLTNGFKNIISSQIVDLILEYFTTNFQTFYHTERMSTVPLFKEKSMVDNMLNNVVQEFGVNSNKLIYLKLKDGQEPVLCSSIDDKTAIPSEILESYGTLRFISLYPIIAEALKSGGTIVLDEFDASIHPMAIMNIISIFHNDDINIHNAQLIFNTHNPLYLNGNILRRDEIKFVERDDNTKCSKHYSLSDFGTKGSNARKGKNYMNNYFVNEYGAIRDIDFTDIFKTIVRNK